MGRDEHRFGYGADVAGHQANVGENRHKWASNAQLAGSLYDALMQQWRTGLDEHRKVSDTERTDAHRLNDVEMDRWKSERDTFWSNQDRQFDKLTYGSNLGAGVI